MSPSTSPAIEVDDLVKTYDKVEAVRGVSFTVARGEVFGFLGPNGAGKTTTLKLLMQLIFPTSGHAEILGRPVGDIGTRRRIGYLPENPSFYDYLTAEELLGYFGELFGYSGGNAGMCVSTIRTQYLQSSCLQVPLVSGGWHNVILRYQGTGTGQGQGGWLDYNAAHRHDTARGRAEARTTLGRLHRLATRMDALLAALH